MHRKQKLVIADPIATIVVLPTFACRASAHARDAKVGDPALHRRHVHPNMLVAWFRCCWSAGITFRSVHPRLGWATECRRPDRSRPVVHAARRRGRQSWTTKPIGPWWTEWFGNNCQSGVLPVLPSWQRTRRRPRRPNLCSCPRSGCPQSRYPHGWRTPLGPLGRRSPGSTTSRIRPGADEGS